MKALKIIGIVLVVLVAAVLVTGLIAPTAFHVERSVTIDAPQDYVWSYTNTLEGMQAWSPWLELDPDQETSLQGTDGTVGAVHSWKGNEDVGEGSQEIMKIEEGHLETHLHFVAPWESHADAFVNVEEAENGQTTVSWGFDSESPFPMNAMMLFMDMDAAVGKDFEKGLNKLKVLVEESKANRKEFGGFTISEAEMDMQTFAGRKDTIGFDEMEAFFKANFGAAYGAAMEQEKEPMGPPCSVYFDWDEEANQCVLLAGVPLKEGENLEGFDAHVLGGKALLIEYYGPYEGSAKAHEAMEAYMKWHGLELRDAVVEEYVTDPTTEPDQSKWLTRVYYPV